MKNLESIFKVIFFNLLFIQNPLKSQNLSSIDSLILNYSINKKFNGIYCISKDDSIIYKKSLGYKDYTCKDKINDSSIFFLASISKVFTSFIIFKNIERGNINLETKVDSILLNFPYHNIKIKDLLNHTSGLQFKFTKFIFNSASIDNETLYKNFTSKNNFITFSKKDLESNVFNYSNFNYILLALIVEKITKMSFAENLQYFNNLDNNINLNLVNFNRNFNQDNFAYPIMYEKEMYKNVFENEIEKDERNAYKNLYGHSNIIANVESIDRCFRLFNKGKIVNLNLYDVDSLIKPGTFYNGLYFFLINKTIPCFCHSGNITGYNNVACFIPRLKTNFILLQNIHYKGIEKEINNLAFKLIQTYFKDIKLK
jgi:hypothetical protein